VRPSADRVEPLAIVLSSGLLPILVGAFLHGFGLEIFSVNWDLAL
jgi:hypothetical protein